MVDVLDGQVELVFVVLAGAAVLRAPVGENLQPRRQAVEDLPLPKAIESGGFDDRRIFVHKLAVYFVERLRIL
jgi:hypothetical protein